MLFNHKFVELELMGALLITSFNLFTIVYKMKFVPESDGDEERTDTEDKSPFFNNNEGDFIELSEDCVHN